MFMYMIVFSPVCYKEFMWTEVGKKDEKKNCLTLKFSVDKHREM